MKIMSIILVCSIIGGSVFFAIQEELIILNLHKKDAIIQHKQAQTNMCTFYWDPIQLPHETMHIPRTDDEQKNLTQLINSWLTFLHSEGIIKNIHVESVLLSSSHNEIFVSFDRYPFDKQQSIDQKLQLIRYLCDTIRPHTNAQKIRLLVHHAPLQDMHLDFMSGQPI